MPYIESSVRPRLDQVAAKAVKELCVHVNGGYHPGELNYVLTKILVGIWQRNHSYRDIALFTGVLENVKQEFYRRVATPYEEKKREENGDVY